MLAEIGLAAMAFFLLIFLLTAASNLFLYPRLQPGVSVDGYPELSICIPARNEGAAIGETIEYLLRQETAGRFELLVLDDQSTDGTREIIRRFAAGDDRLRLIDGAPLPNGWLGKNWACHQLSERASGELILFTDADVTWRPGALDALLDHRRITQADCLSVWPTQLTGSWSEWLVVPLMKFAILGYLPIMGVHFLPWPAFAAANGQALLFKADFYRRIGGHAAVRREIVEDVALARATKEAGGRLRLVDGNELVACRMYTSWREVRAGFGKNILAGHGGSVPFLALSTLWHWAAFVVPWMAVLAWPSWATGGLLAAAVALRWLTEIQVDRRPLVGLLRALTMPLGVVLMTAIAGQALHWHYGSGPKWKARTIQE